MVVSKEEEAVMKSIGDVKTSKYILSLFDFGGQSVFDVIHPFFLTHYGVYIVVFSMKDILDAKGEFD